MQGQANNLKLYSVWIIPSLPGIGVGTYLLGAARAVPLLKVRRLAC